MAFLAIFLNLDFILDLTRSSFPPPDCCSLFKFSPWIAGIGVVGTAQGPKRSKIAIGRHLDGGLGVNVVSTLLGVVPSVLLVFPVSSSVFRVESS